MGCVRVYVCLYLELWGEYSSKEVGLSGEVGFIGKGGHDFVVRKISGVLRAKHLKDMVAVVCVRV